MEKTTNCLPALSPSAKAIWLRRRLFLTKLLVSTYLLFPLLVATDENEYRYISGAIDQ